MSMSSYIKSDLRARLQSGHPLPSGLTLESLAAHYEVSLTPVRVAVAELVEAGWLRKGPNRRLTPAIGDDRTAERPAEPQSSPEPPRDLLRVVGNDLVRRSLDGKSIFLREEAAAKRYGISRSAVRDVFHRLAGMGMLTHVPRRGWELRPFRQEDMQAFLEVRELLELKALELAQPRMDDDELRAMLNRNVLPESEGEWPRIDNSLHSYLIDRAGNRYIKDFFERQGRYYDILFDWEDHDRDAAIETVRQHRQILEAILRRDWQAARSALAWHIRGNHPILSRIAARRQSSV